MKKFLRQFGGKVTKELVFRYQASDYWIKGSFKNLERTRVAVPWSKVPVILYKQIVYRKDREPKKKIPIIPFNKNQWNKDGTEARFVWYGHSVLLLKIQGKNILVDPMFGNDTTPIAPIPTERFSIDALNLIEDLPDVDLVLLTHDHYDHLDMISVDKLKSKVKNWYVAMGVGRHLEAWGVDEEKIREFNWWDSVTLSGIDITCTPSRHFSGRGFNDRSKSLWGGWVINNGIENIWISGDGGYGKHFKEIGERLGPFDLAFVECGQYNSDWHEMHMFPDESIQAAIDAKVKKAIPIHWGAFSLSYQHTWYEPVEHFILSAHENNMDYSSPPLGKIFNIQVEEVEQWWLPYV